MTNLPASEESFLRDIPESTKSLSEAIDGQANSTLSSFAALSLGMSLLGRFHSHIHRPHLYGDERDLSGDFWKRYRLHDNTLLNISSSLSGYFRLPAGVGDPNVIFYNLIMHACTVVLHRTATRMAEKHRLPREMAAESKRRCIVAAEETCSILRMMSRADVARVSMSKNCPGRTCHTNWAFCLLQLHPFVTFPIVVSARIISKQLRVHPDDVSARSSLTLLSNMFRDWDSIPIYEHIVSQMRPDLDGVITLECPLALNVGVPPSLPGFV